MDLIKFYSTTTRHSPQLATKPSNSASRAQYSTRFTNSQSQKAANCCYRASCLQQLNAYSPVVNSRVPSAAMDAVAETSKLSCVARSDSPNIPVSSSARALTASTETVPQPAQLPTKRLFYALEISVWTRINIS